MTDEDLMLARAWAETAEPYPVKRGYLTLLGEIDRLRGLLTTLGAALIDEDDRQAVWGAVFSEYGSDRAREVFDALNTAAEGQR